MELPQTCYAENKTKQKKKQVWNSVHRQFSRYDPRTPEGVQGPFRGSARYSLSNYRSMCSQISFYTSTKKQITIDTDKRIQLFFIKLYAKKFF